MASPPESNVASESRVLPMEPQLEGEEVEKTRTRPAEVSEPGDEDEISYPEGGLQAWLVVCGSFCGMYVDYC